MKTWICIISLFLTSQCFSKNIDVTDGLKKQLSECIVSNSPEFLLGLRSPKKYHFEFKDQPTLVIGKNRYVGISGYKAYRSKTLSKEDYALNLNVLGLNAIQLTIQEAYENDPRPADQIFDRQYYMYYVIFKNSIEEVARKLGIDERDLDKTLQGNVRYTCWLVG